MENGVPGIGVENDDRRWHLYGFEVGISDYRNHFQAGGGLQLPNQPLCTFGKETEGKRYANHISSIYDQGNLSLFNPEYIPNIITDPEQATSSYNTGIWGLLEGQAESELNSVKNGLDITWSIKESSTLKSNLPSSTLNIFGSPYNGLFQAASDQKGYQDWATETSYPLCLDPNNVTNTMLSAETRVFPLGSQPNLKILHKNSQKTTVSVPGSPKLLPTAFVPVNSPSSLDGSTSNFTAAHRAVTELFPELADACNFEAKKSNPHEEIPGSQDIRLPKRLIATKADSTARPTLSLDLSEANIAKGPIKRKRSLHSNLGYLEKSPLPKSTSPEESPGLEEREKISERSRKLGILPRSQTTFFTLPSPLFTITAQSLKAEQLSQLSSDLVNLDLKNSGRSHPFGIEGETSRPAVTISPRCLSKLQLPLMSPKQSAFDFEDGYYVSKVVLCEEGESVAEADIPGILDIETEFTSSRLDDSGSSPFLPPQTKPPEISHNDSLPLQIPVLNPRSFNPSLPTPTNQDIAQCSISSPERPPRSPRQKPRVKGTSRNRAIKNNSKELLKEQNQLLLRWRSQGISYKTIKERLGIDEAESTLRGRLRTLTKPKSERLRKPRWTEEDIMLLLEAVDPALLSVKWKQVSETIVTLGGSYRFGPSTCKKQYMKLVANGRARPLEECTLEKRSKTDFEAGNLGLSSRRPRHEM